MARCGGPGMRAVVFGGRDAVFICSYFIHLDPVLGAHGEFLPRQWENCPESSGSGRSKNWLQLFIFSAARCPFDDRPDWAAFNGDAVIRGATHFWTAI